MLNYNLLIIKNNLAISFNISNKEIVLAIKNYFIYIFRLNNYHVSY